MKGLIGWLVTVILVLISTGFLLVTYQQAHHLVHYPIEVRALAKRQPQDVGVQVQEGGDTQSQPAKTTWVFFC